MFLDLTSCSFDRMFDLRGVLKTRIPATHTDLKVGGELLKSYGNLPRETISHPKRCHTAFSCQCHLL